MWCLQLRVIEETLEIFRNKNPKQDISIFTSISLQKV